MKTIMHYVLLSVFFYSQAASAQASNLSILEEKSWGLASHIYTNSDGFQVNSWRTLANYAMPSKNSTYFVTPLEKNTTYSFSGSLPQDEDIIFSSLTIYDTEGNIVTKNGVEQTWSMKSKPKFENYKFNIGDQRYFAIERFYRSHGNDSLRIFSSKSRNNYLLKIDKSGSPLPQASLSRVKMDTKFLQKILTKKLSSISHAVPSTSQMNKDFKIPRKTSGLFVNAYALYAIASPSSDVEYVKISGIMSSSGQASEKDIVFISFMAVDYQTTKTLAAISSEDLGGFNGKKYEFYIAKSQESVNTIRKKHPQAIVLYWGNDVTEPGVVFRMLGTKMPSKSDFQNYKPSIEYYDSNGKLQKGSDIN
ncbi:MAG: hypothetical protein CMF55_02890 [Legionellales bacterium]|nr:hypothetical protein [Legionellales bacterium]HAG61744.1 hypothetical protein [Coxiellaceae bacterium]|tara:strand:+ start:141 stop:1229 length:1089 start_codon:yes stop_codon:yes gene_type:complete